MEVGIIKPAFLYYFQSFIVVFKTLIEWEFFLPACGLFAIAPSVVFKFRADEL